MAKPKTTMVARSKVCAFRLTPAMHKKVVAKLKRINEQRASLADPVYGVGDFFHAATLALLSDDLAVCREWLADVDYWPKPLLSQQRRR